MTERKVQRKGTNSISRHVDAFAKAGQDIPLPAGFVLRSPEEEEVWRAFAAARSRDDWLPHDLIMLVKIVQLEIDIRAVKVKLNNDGFIVENARGTMVENAALRVWDTLLRMQLAVIRSLSINSSASAKTVVEKSAKDDQKALKKMQESGVTGLLAMPGEIN